MDEMDKGIATCSYLHSFRSIPSMQLYISSYFILLMAEILHQLIGSLSHYLQGFRHHTWCRISSINSRICMQDVSGFHCQASSLRIQWPLPSQALHVLANPNNPQRVSGKLHGSALASGCASLLNGNSGFRGEDNFILIPFARLRFRTGISHIHRSKNLSSLPETGLY